MVLEQLRMLKIFHDHKLNQILFCLSQNIFLLEIKLIFKKFNFYPRRTYKSP